MKTSKTLLIYLSLIWLLPVIAFSYSPNYSPSPLPVWMAFILSLLLTYLDKRVIVAIIPFIALISPLTGPNNFFPVLPSELYILLCFVIGILFLLLKKEIKIELLKGDYLLIVLLLITVFSFFLSFEALNLFKSITSIVMLLTIVLLTRSFVKAKDDIELILNSFVLSAVFACILSIASLVGQVNLSSFVEGIESGVDLEALYIRASFFYANVGYFLGVASIISLLSFFYAKGFSKALYAVSTLLIISTLILMIEKTSLVALAVSLVCLWFLFSLKTNVLNTVFSAFLISVSALTMYFLVLSFSGDADLDVRFQIGGFYERLCVAGSTLEVFLNNPIRLFFGFGPDASILLDNQYTIAAKLNCMGYSEGAIDSGLLSYLFDYGLIFVLSFIAFILVSLFYLYKELMSREDEDNKFFFIGITSLIFISLSISSDVLSTSKIAWSIYQLFALLGIIINIPHSRNQANKIDKDIREVRLSAQ